MINPKDFESRWEFSKATSNYHFDSTIDEDASPPFKRVGRFEGDWMEEVRRCERLAPKRDITFQNRLTFNGGGDPYTSRMDSNDLANLGVPSDWVLYSGVSIPFSFTKLRAMVNWFGLDNVKAALHVQHPGQVFFYHIDNLTGLRNNEHEASIARDPSTAARFGIALEDWQPGHVWAIGNTYWKQWRAGDIIWHDWINTPHGTANLGHRPRYILQVTGIVTDRTREILNSAEPVVVAI